jgi:hypothetical protein
MRIKPLFAPGEPGDHVVTLIDRTLSLWRQLVRAMHRIIGNMSPAAHMLQFV